jgi:serine/threonine-protein kinase
VAPSDPFGLVGEVLDGHFRVERCVGEGGFSIVYKGTHVGLGEPIAIKCLKLPAALGSAIVESFIKRFRDESRLQYKLSQGHLHVVRSIASGTTIAPSTSALVPFTVLEWLEGRSLAAEYADRQERRLGPRPLEEVVRFLDSAVDAIAYAHAQGVVHRDLNPGNFFLARTPAGVRVKILDFGVAKVMADSALAMGPSARTIGNIRMFAPAYGAPEQFDERVGAIGPWTDVYAVALVALEALRGAPVVDGEHLGEFAMKALDPVIRPTPRRLGSAVGDAVERVFAQAVALRPGDRPRDAGEFWGMLKHAMHADSDSGRPPHAEPSAFSREGFGNTVSLGERLASVRVPDEVGSQAANADLAARGRTLRVDRSPVSHAPGAGLTGPAPEDRAVRASEPAPRPSSSVTPAPIGTAAPIAIVVALTLAALGIGGTLIWYARSHPHDAPVMHP